MPLYLSVPDGHCASSARSCLAPKALLLLSTPWMSLSMFALTSLAKGRSIKDAPPTLKKSTSTQQLQTQQIKPQQQTNFPPQKKQPATSKPNPTLKKQKPTKTDQHNFKDENGTWIQSIFSE
jgi:hypothetical protein